jgi:hypothetical protein
MNKFTTGFLLCFINIIVSAQISGTGVRGEGFMEQVDAANFSHPQKEYHMK